jgi:hypothetical protein
VRSGGDTAVRAATRCRAARPARPRTRLVAAPMIIAKLITT